MPLRHDVECPDAPAGQLAKLVPWALGCYCILRGQDPGFPRLTASTRVTVYSIIFWHRLGAPFHPILVPKWTPKSTKNRPKINPRCNHFFDWLLDHFFNDLGIDFGAKIDPKIDQKSIKNHSKNQSKNLSTFWCLLERFLDRFLVDFGLHFWLILVYLWLISSKLTSVQKH